MPVHFGRSAPSASPAGQAGYLRRVAILDSHTAGEPTRLVLEGGPALRGASVADQLASLQAEAPDFRPSVVLEPRGSDVVVGALLCQAQQPEHIGVIFFNDVGYLGMCGHGTIGVIASLAHLGRIGPGEHTLETSVGTVQACLRDDGSVTVANVGSYRYLAEVLVDVPGLGTVSGDVAWGGNWFFLISTPPPVPLRPGSVAELTRLASAVRQALEVAGITGPNGERVDHIEWFDAPADPANHSRNFVLCPGAAYDRSPCGTGTSAKLACLAARGDLAPGETWLQEGILGTVFEARYEVTADGTILPEITGRAWVTSEATLLFDESDPFQSGIRA